MKGKELFEQIVAATGLPQDLVRKELESLIKTDNLSIENLNLDAVRNILANYLQDILLAQADS